MRSRHNGVLVVLASIALTALSLLAGAIQCPAASAQGRIPVTVYFSPTCDYCELVKEQFLPDVLDGREDSLAIEWVDASTAEGLAKLEADEALVEQYDNPLPVFVVGDGDELRIIADEDPFALQEALAAALDGASASGAVGRNDSLGNPGGESTNASASGAKVHIAYVRKAGCDSCDRASLVLDAVAETYPQMVVTAFDVLSQGDVVEAMGEALGIEEERRMVAPSVYVGSKALVGGSEITSGNLSELVGRYAAEGADPFWDELDLASGRDSIAQRFRTMGPTAVVLAGLIDGVNPCAFATILFFVSYLAISRRGKGALLAVGLAFTLGVFVTYLAVGFGAMSVLRVVSAVHVVGRALFGLFAALCLALAVLSFQDYRLARQGRLHDMLLNLPEPLRERIHGRIRSGGTAYLGAAFLSGVIVSLLELACTGQVYLPTITFMVGVPEMRAAAVGYLVLYNVMFVVPLLVVLGMATYGVSAVRFQDWFVRNAAASKLVMSVLFLSLGVLLGTQALGLW